MRLVRGVLQVLRTMGKMKHSKALHHMQPCIIACARLLVDSIKILEQYIIVISPHREDARIYLADDYNAKLRATHICEECTTHTFERGTPCQLLFESLYIIFSALPSLDMLPYLAISILDLLSVTNANCAFVLGGWVLYCSTHPLEYD